MLDLTQIDKTWTLFLDRDGVINKERHLEYVTNWSEFIFYDGVKDALKIFNEKFGVIVMATNQRGVIKGLMTLDDLHSIHNNMVAEVEISNGRIDHIYFCTDANNDSPNRKPNPGMAFKAKADFDTIDFSKSIMVGNKMSDMSFGRNAGMNTVFLATTNPDTSYPNEAIDLRFNTLIEFAQALTKA